MLGFDVFFLSESFDNAASNAPLTQSAIDSPASSAAILYMANLSGVRRTDGNRSDADLPNIGGLPVLLKMVSIYSLYNIVFVRSII